MLVIHIFPGIVQPDKIIASSPQSDALYVDEMGVSVSFIFRLMIAQSYPDFELFFNQKLGCQTTYDNTEVVQRSNIVILAVKPPIVPKVLAEVAPSIQSTHLMVSIALGIPIRNLEQV